MVQEKQDGDELTDSVTQFFTHNVTCDKSMNGYFHWKCVTGQCTNCNDNRPWPLRCSTSQAMVKSSQFKLNVNIHMTSQKPRKTVRVEQTKTYQETYKQLESMKTTYLTHKFYRDFSASDMCHCILGICA